MPDASMEDLIAQLRHEDPVMRIQACLSLSKLGDPAAITDLTRVYQQEDDLVVREAAADALRGFARKEGGGGSSGLRNLAVLLVVSLVVLAALNVVTRMGSADDDADEVEVDVTAQVEPSDRAALLDGYLNQWGAASEDVAALRAEWNAGDEVLPCTAELNRPEPLVVQQIDRHTYPDIAFVDAFNEALTTLQGVTAEWDAACASTEPATEAQITSATLSLEGIDTAISEVGIAIGNAMANPAPTNTPLPTATSDAPATPEASLEPTTPPTPTITPTPNPELDPVLRDLERIIGNTESELNSLIINKWTPWQNQEPSAFGCTASSFGDPFNNASAELLAQEPDLGNAIQQINGALLAAQGSADLYKTNCEANTLNQAIIADGIAQAEAALADIQSARDTLNQLYP